MLGNDVVDLKLASRQSDWRRPNYLSKIFAVEEQHLILAAADPDLMVWLLWSMKESAYKIVNRKSGLRSYNPLDFNCRVQLDGATATGKVVYPMDQFVCTTKITKNVIHTLAVQDSQLLNDIKVVYLQNEVDYEERFHALHSPLALAKSDLGLPQVLNLAAQTVHTATISHHGEHVYIGYLDTPTQIL